VMLAVIIALKGLFYKDIILVIASKSYKETIIRKRSRVKAYIKEDYLH
jgi:hypothetical protein